MNRLVTVAAENIEVRLSYCLYRSTATPGINKNELDQILEKSRTRNRERGLSGCLHYENSVFFQWLEGPPSELYPLLNKLQNDGRHINFTVLDQGTLEHRLFQKWQMRFSDRKIASLFDWLSTQDKAEFNANNYVDDIKKFLAYLDA